MAENDQEQAANAESSGGGGGGGGGESDGGGAAKCPPCPSGLPGWLATFSDLCTLLLTFFVLLLSFAKTETAKYEAAMGSIRNAFGGNVLKMGEVIQRGKSPDNAPTMLESSETARPFPIEFLTTEGLLDKHEINKSSDEELSQMKQAIVDYELNDLVQMEEIPEGIKVRLKDHIYFQASSVKIEKASIEVFEKIVKMLQNEDWVLFIEGFADTGETSEDGSKDAFMLSAFRTNAVAKALIQRGVHPNKITTIFYGDTRANEEVIINDQITKEQYNRRVEFILRKKDLRSQGHKVD